MQILSHPTAHTLPNPAASREPGWAPELPAHTHHITHKPKVNMEVDKQHARYMLREATQQHHLATQVDYYAVLSLEKTVGEDYRSWAAESSRPCLIQQPADRRGEWSILSMFGPAKQNNPFFLPFPPIFNFLYFAEISNWKNKQKWHFYSQFFYEFVSAPKQPRTYYEIITLNFP